MIDHVSIGVRDLAQATSFYESILSILGLRKLVEQSGTVGFGKEYPEFWLNHRPEMPLLPNDNGCHICLRAKGPEAVEGFYLQALKLGASSSGEPGFRPEYHDSYYACFIRDADQNHVEVVTFVQD